MLKIGLWDYCIFKTDYSASATTISEVADFSIWEASVVNPHPFLEDPHEANKNNIKVITNREVIIFFILIGVLLIFNDEIYKLFYEHNLFRVYKISSSTGLYGSSLKVPFARFAIIAFIEHALWPNNFDKP